MNNLSHLIEEIRSIIKEKKPGNYKISGSDVYLVIDPEGISCLFRSHKLLGNIIFDEETMMTYEYNNEIGRISVEKMLNKNGVTENSKIIFPVG